jgi:hypothetical protein
VIHYHRIDDTTWPVDWSSDQEDSAEWVLRYGTTERREAQRMSVASILSAYSHLVDPTLSSKGAQSALRRARKAAITDAT